MGKPAEKSTRSVRVVAVPVPPDGGYGWVIVAASFTLSVILDGICFSIGIFFNEFLDYFEGSKSQTAWVGSVMNGMYMIMGPFVSGLCNRFGCRPVATAGCLFTCFSFLLATFMPTLPLLTLTFGAMGGIGFGLFYLPAIVMVGFYFEKKRALATGIAVCGSGIGGAVFAPFCTYLIEQYAWKGAILILAGVTLNGMVMTALFRPLTATIETTEQEMPPPADVPTTTGQSVAYFCSLAEMPKLSPSEVPLTRSCDQIWSGPTVRRPGQRLIDVGRPGCRQDAFYTSGSLLRIPEYRETKSPYICSVTSLPAITEEDPGTPGVSRKLARALRSAVNVVKETFDVDVLRRPSFLVYGACCLLCMLGFFVPFAYVPRLAVEHGFSAAEAANIISIMSATNVVGRVAVGLLSDQPWVDCIVINNGALILGGLAVVCIPHFPTIVPLAISSVFFGIAIAAFVSLRSIIMVELMGLEKLSSAFGFVTLFQGSSSLIGTPIAGALSDYTGNFHAAFYMAGIALTLSGLICLPLRRIAAWEKSWLEPCDSTNSVEDKNEQVKLMSVPEEAT